MRRRPRPHLFTPAARELFANVALSVVGAALVLLIKRVVDAFPFLIGG